MIKSTAEKGPNPGVNFGAVQDFRGVVVGESYIDAENFGSEWEL